MADQDNMQGGFPQNQTAGQDTYSTTGDGHPPRPGERRTQEGMAGQGTGQMDTGTSGSSGGSGMGDATTGSGMTGGASGGMGSTGGGSTGGESTSGGSVGTTSSTDSGIGTQFTVADVDGDGLLDVVSANKKGVRVIVQRRK